MSEKGKETSPAPNSSTSSPDCEAALTSFIVTGRSETTKFSGRCGSRLTPETWSRARARTESLVTPGRIIPSSGGVTSSIANSTSLSMFSTAG